MTEPMAFKATYSDFRLVRTRGVVQVVMEIPLENSTAVLKVLGGMPDGTRWFGIAPLDLSQAEKETDATASKSTPAKLQPESPKHSAGAKRDWRDLQPAAQAGIRCSEPMFQAFLRESYDQKIAGETDAAGAVRTLCGVHSRVELGTKHAARVLWHQLDTEYQAWLQMERAGA